MRIVTSEVLPRPSSARSVTLESVTVAGAVPRSVAVPASKLNQPGGVPTTLKVSSSPSGS